MELQLDCSPRAFFYCSAITGLRTIQFTAISIYLLISSRINRPNVAVEDCEARRRVSAKIFLVTDLRVAQSEIYQPSPLR